MMALTAAAVLTLPGAAQAGGEKRPCLKPDADLTVWQIGTFEGDTGFGAGEYPATDSHWDLFEYTATGIDLTPDFPGYLAPGNMSTVVGDGRLPTDAATAVAISWTQCRTLDLTLEYGRYGSETDLAYLDGVLVGELAIEENAPTTLLVELEAVPAGDHTLTIEYIGGGVGNGHYIDALRMEGTPIAPTCPDKGHKPHCGR